MPKDALFDLLVIGNCAMDYTFIVESFPAIDEKCSSRDLVILGGGQGGNIAWAAARMGLKCSLLTKIGDDENGDLLVRDLEKVGVDASHVVRQPGGRTPITAIISDSSTSSRTCIHNKTGIRPLSISEIDFELCHKARLLVTDSRSPDVSSQCASISRESGTLVIVAMEHMNEEIVRLCSLADIVIAPMSLVNQPGTDSEREPALQHFASKLRMDTLVATLGDKGCLLLSSGAVRWFPGRRVEVVDTIGAGDAFTAGVCYALLQGWPLEKACVFGNFIGACACEGEGARSSSIPDASSISAILTSLGLEKSREEQVGE
jgi:sugar/nucleoside kinase (ribokinase family)